MFAAALVVVAVVVVVVVASWLLARFSGRPAVFHPASGGIADVAAVPATPEPRLEARPGTTLSSLRQSEDRRLGSYGWIDRAAGVVRIPIERAMELTAQRGLSVRPGAPAVMEPTAVGSASGRFLEPRAR
jgi:hypothetical protein